MDRIIHYFRFEGSKGSARGGVAVVMTRVACFQGDFTPLDTVASDLEAMLGGPAKT